MVNADLFEITNSRINTAIDKGVNSLDDNIKNIAFTNQLRSSAGVFSVFKGHHNTQAISALLIGKDGNLVPFNVFKTEALKVSNKHLKSWLRTEYNTAIRRATVGANFQQYLEDIDLYPNLRWTPSRSETPRNLHEQLYGLVLPVNAPFWVDNFPGNLWNCKCGLEQTTASAGTAPKSKIEVPSGLDGNPAFTGDIIAKSHPYFKGVDNKGSVSQEFEKFKLSFPFHKKPNYVSKNGGKVFVHRYADPVDVVENFDVAKLMLDKFKLDLKIRPHCNNIITGLGDTKRKNPGYLINGLVADLKKIEGNNISNTIGKAKKQGNEVVVFYIKNDLSVQRIIEKLNGNFNARTNGNPFKEIYIIKDNEVVKY